VQKGRADPFALLFDASGWCQTRRRLKNCSPATHRPSKTVALRSGSNLNGGNAGGKVNPGGGNLLPPVVQFYKTSFTTTTTAVGRTVAIQV